MFVNFILFLLFIYLLSYWRKRKFSHLPCPPYFVPWLGHLPLLFNKGDPINHAARLYRQYSKSAGLLYTHVVGLDHVLVGDFQVMKYLFNHPNVANRGSDNIHQNVFHKKVGYDRGWDLSAPSFGILINQGESWVQQRRGTLKTLRDFGFGKSSTEEAVSNEVKRFLRLLQSDYEDRAVCLQGKFSLPILNVLWSFCAGEQFDYDNPKLQKMLANITEFFRLADSGRATSILHLTTPLWVFKLFPRFLNRHVPSMAYEMIVPFLEEVIEEHYQTLDQDNPRDFIDTMLITIIRTTDDQSSFYGKTGRANLLNSLVDLFLAGAETTATTLTWAMLYMVREQEVQRKVQQELDSVIGRGRLPLMTDRQNLPYTEAVIMEIQRCGNIAPMAIHHVNTEPIEVNGVTIPANTMISPIMVEILKGEHWGQDGHKFRPERFIDSEGKVIYDEHLVPFSIGKRRCLGESLAKIELFQFFTGILQNYSVLPEDANSIPGEDYIMGITISPKPFNCILKSR